MSNLSISFAFLPFLSLPFPLLVPRSPLHLSLSHKLEAAVHGHGPERVVAVGSGLEPGGLDLRHQVGLGWVSGWVGFVCPK